MLKIKQLLNNFLGRYSKFAKQFWGELENEIVYKKKKVYIP